MATKKRKPAITGMARPHGIIDDILAPLGKEIVGQVRRDVRHSIKRGNTVERMFGNRVPEKFTARETRVTLRDSRALDDAKRSYFSRRGQVAGMSQKEIDSMVSSRHFTGVPREYHNEFAKIYPQERSTLNRRAISNAMKKLHNGERAVPVKKAAKKVAKKATRRAR